MEISLSHLTSFVVISGISGAGRSTALHKMSDMGFYIVDNLPIPLLPHFIDFTKQLRTPANKTSITVDTDDLDKVEQFLLMSGQLDRNDNRFLLIFLDCDTEMVVKRYSETRRPHPKFDPQIDTSLEDTVQRERVRLAPLKFRSHLTIDTTSLNLHELRRELVGFVESFSLTTKPSLRVTFISFGFKYGAPRDCDLIIDIRFLRNPYFVDAFRERVGLDPEVAGYVFDSDGAKEFLQRYTELLDFLLPQYAAEGKAYLNIGVGCTGGKHRSVAIAEELRRRLDREGLTMQVRHRDIKK